MMNKKEEMTTLDKKREKFLKEHYLTEFHNQFVRFSGMVEQPSTKRKLNEWSFLPSSLDEDGEDDDSMNDDNAPIGNQASPMDNMNGGLPNDNSNTPMGNDMNQGNTQIDNAPMGGVNQGAPSIPPPSDNNEPSMNDTPEESDYDELDITDLTDAQEKMNKKINAVGKEISNNDDSISQLMVTLNKINDIIKSNNEKIEDLEREIKKRNPTPLEKLDLRAVYSSKPYNIRPNDFWGDKLNDLDNYDVYNENEPNKTEKEYVITTDDINDASSTDISQSFDDIDMDLEKIFGLK